MRRIISILGILVVLFWPLLLWRESFEALREQKTFPVSTPVSTGVQDKKASGFGSRNSSTATSTSALRLSPTIVAVAGFTATSSVLTNSLVSSNLSALSPVPISVSSAGFGGGMSSVVYEAVGTSGGGGTAAGRDFDDETCPLL